MLACLQNQYRRRLLVALLENNPEEAIAIPEDIHRGEVELERLQIQLHHSHLPKLDECGYIDWQKNRNIVRRGKRFNEIESLVKLIYQN
ncbi:DUF7344 domain-containing protein [Haloarcula nitratireducens]|uniref:DUF7344 domain-containing protein n=1 Tax=Haloarcula nitratireducens TaxID=2487749 RepID=UPI003CCBDE63